MVISSEMLFEDAAEAFYQLRMVDPDAPEGYVRENTLAGYRRHIASLKLFFAGLRLEEIRWFHMKAYQKARRRGDPPFLRYRRPQDAREKHLKDGTVIPAKGKTPCAAKPQQVNQEMDFLKRLKFLGDCWTDEDRKYYRSLQEEESDVPRAATPEQQMHWLDAARGEPDLMVIFYYSLVAFDTCCSPNELQRLRLGDVRLGYQMINIPWPCAKNRFRHREIAIEDTNTLWALNELLRRARELGSGPAETHPTHYLFPFRDPKTRRYDPTRPMTSSGLKKQWQRVRDAAGMPWFRFEDTRHTGATRLAEQGVPVDIIVARMGHCDDKMRQHYTHISLAAQRSWLRKGPQRVYSIEAHPESFPHRARIRY